MSFSSQIDIKTILNDSFIFLKVNLDAHVRSKRSENYYDNINLICDSDYDEFYNDYCTNDQTNDNTQTNNDFSYQFCSEKNCKVSKWMSDDDPSFSGDHENFV